MRADNAEETQVGSCSFYLETELETRLGNVQVKDANQPTSFGLTDARISVITLVKHEDEGASTQMAKRLARALVENRSEGLGNRSETA